MKTKLLKKVRKRFFYYWNSSGLLIIGDRQFKYGYIVDNEFQEKYYPLSEKEKKDKETMEWVKNNKEEWHRRLGIDFMTKRFDVHWYTSQSIFKKGQRKFKFLRKQGRARLKPKDE